MRLWTEDEDRHMRAMAEAKQSAAQIGKLFGRSRNSVIGYADRNGIQLQGQIEIRRKGSEINKVIRLWKKGVTMREIGLETNRSLHSVRALIRRLRSKGLIGFRHHQRP